MSRYIFCGAETKVTTGIATMEASALTSGVTIETTVKRTGAASWKADTGGVNAAQTARFAVQGGTVSGSSYYYAAYLCFGTLPTSDAEVMKPSGASAVEPRIRVTTTGKAQLWIGSTSQVGSDSAATIIADGATWYLFELWHESVSASGSRQYEARLNGVTIASGANGTFTADTQMFVGWGSAPGTNRVVYIDDVAANDVNGAVNNSWIGQHAAVLLLPVSDNARAALWTGGAGGTTNLWDAVDNTPPAGTATETNTTQIEHAGGASGTTDAYDANMATYASVGIAAADTINAIRFIEVDGEDIATGTKLLNFEVLSNPVIASPGNVTAGSDIGALGTFPTNWTKNASTPVQNPSVTVGTNPVMRARRPETASRVASVCFMGMYVDYTPAASAFAPPFDARNRRRPHIRVL